MRPKNPTKWNTDRIRRIHEEGQKHIDQLEDWVRRNRLELESNLRRAHLDCKHKRDKGLGVCSICGEVMR